MKKQLLTALLLPAYILFMSPLTSCNSNAKDELAHHHHDHGHHHGEGEEHDHGHEDEHEHEHGHEHGHVHTGKEITLEPEQAKALGVKVVTVKGGEFSDVVKVAGQVSESADGASVASAPTSGTVTFAPGIVEGKKVSAGTLIATIKAGKTTGGDPNAAARANLEAAKRELDRVTPLHEHGIVSTADYNAAVAAYNAAKAAYSPNAASGRVVATTSGVITGLDVKSGQYVEAGTPIASVSATAKLTLRADVPQRLYGKIGQFSNAKIVTPYSREAVNLADMGGKRINSSEAVATGGYIPVYFSFNNNGALVPGTPVEVYLLGTPRENVITVPIGALSEQQGNFFVYVQVDPECYIKTPVTRGLSDGEKVEITSGLKAGDKVVSEGMTSVRLAESSGVVPEGHSHNH